MAQTKTRSSGRSAGASRSNGNSPARTSNARRSNGTSPARAEQFSTERSPSYGVARRASSQREKRSASTKRASGSTRSRQSRSRGARSGSSASRQSTNGVTGTLTGVGDSIGSAVGKAGDSVGTVAQKAKTPALVGTAAAAGLAGGIALGARMLSRPKVAGSDRPVEARQRSPAGGAFKSVAHECSRWARRSARAGFRLGVGDVNMEVQRGRKEQSRFAARGPAARPDEPPLEAPLTRVRDRNGRRRSGAHSILEAGDELVLEERVPVLAPLVGELCDRARALVVVVFDPVERSAHAARGAGAERLGDVALLA